MSTRKNKYKQKTPILGIPVIGQGDAIWPELELKKWTIIENMLVSASRGINNCLFSEGALSVVGNKVRLAATGQSYAAEGVVGGCYFRAADIVEWPLPTDMAFAYLYIKGTTATKQVPTSVRAAVSRSKIKDAVLIATMDIQNGKLIKRPEGKVFAGDLIKHVGESHNPHGDVLLQDEIQVSTLRVDGQEVVPSIARDIQSGGKTGVVVDAGMAVRFAQVSRSGKLTSDKLGEVSVGYYGFDKKATKPEEFVVYNDGSKGIPLRVLIS